MEAIDKYKRRFKKARSTADLWISLLEACYHYAVPSRNLFYWTSQYQGAQKNAKVYDTTAVSGLKTFVAKIQNSLTPPQVKWCLLTTSEDVANEDKEKVDDELKEATDIIFKYLHRSNFDVVINECFYDLGIGTGVLLCLEGTEDKPLLFYSVPAARVALEESTNCLLENCWRWWDEIRIEDIEIIWPKANITSTMEEQLKQDPTATIKMLVEGTIYDPNLNKFKYVLFHNEDILLEETIVSSPWIVFRWSKVNNEAYGRGPVIDALPAILSLNEVARIELTAANMNISKPIMAFSDGIFNPWTFRMEPNTIIPVAPNAQGVFPLQPFPDTANPEFMQFTANDLRNQINKLLYSDPLGPIEDTPKTATEIGLRQRNLGEEVGPTFMRLQEEFLARLIDRVIFILQKKGKLKQLKVNGQEIRYKYQSPLILQQGNSEIETFSRWFQLQQGVFGPEAAAMFINPVQFPRWSSRKMGVEPTIILSSEEIEQVLNQESEKRQMQEKMMMEEAANGNQRNQAKSLATAA